VTKPKRRKRHKKVGTNPSGAANQPPVEPNAPVEAETPTPAATPAESSTVTMEGKDAGRAEAQTLLDGANSRLALIDRSKLTGDTSAAFQQASGLAHAARKAMDQGDYLAASGLARKASTLADQVAARISSQ
jgi:hypothetical protein